MEHDTSTLWTIVHTSRYKDANGRSVKNRPVIPFDCNPGSDDEGMLVYRSLEAASNAADHQRETYGIKCKACQLNLADLS